MKKKLLLIITSITALSLTSCDLLMDIFNGGTNLGASSISQTVASSKEPIIDISTPPADDIASNHASKIYADYVKNNLYPLSSTPSTGEANLLVIPVWFTDSNKYIKDANKESVREDIHDTYFGDTNDTGWQSVKTYYETESFGTLTLTGTVSAWYEPGKSTSYYAKSSALTATISLVEQATDWYFTNHTSENRSDYDCDGDGYLDGVMLIYAAPDYGTLKNDEYDNLWAFCYWVQDYSAQNVSNPGVNAFFWASYDFMYGREVASSRTGNRYYAGDTSHCKLDAHTYIHEMGHMFGLEDYYDYSSYSYSPAGGFSMQDCNVGCHDPFSSFALGWGKAYIPTTSATINLKPFSTSGEMILLSPSWNGQNSAFDEYILIEYYTDEGLNALDTTYGYMSQYGKAYPLGPKENGIRVWHVDARLLYSSTGVINPSRMTTNPSIISGRVVLCMSNTYNDGDANIEGYLSPVAQDPKNNTYYNATYAEYNLLQMIRNSQLATSKNKDYLSSSSLFKKGDTFSMNSFKRQFVNQGKFNSGLDLGFEFTVNACNNTYASISVKKL